MWYGMSKWISGLVVRFREEQGQALAEYSLILAFIFVVCIIAVGALGLALVGQLNVVTAVFP